MTKKTPEFKHVLLKDKDGNDHQATTPAEVNSLVYGHGYSLADTKQTVDQAIADLAADDEPAATSTAGNRATTTQTSN